MLLGLFRDNWLIRVTGVIRVIRVIITPNPKGIIRHIRVTGIN